ncbi:hypothetical protein K432DRAFT_384250 [Lepidopterella palustris CBS 459.81]|uniref:SWI-SNF chromatin-remodeling complex protein n=1 Tax=Lepidopterella palustris CBS 459.81 TaxID=1314670 RepID=A0A8E2JD07_9PEZI|nr:hypothetical protein K432DRAFT_384250 [Lepidopterella palustris CBS 459.81]
MSRPYQFTEETTRSPLDRQPPNVFTTGQPPSFKTNVNRAKTKRWVEAKSYAYDGDDWGEYDEYDEYGADEPEPAPPSKQTAPTGFRQKGQSASESGRNFTDPQTAGLPLVPRKNSFDAGDERRAFSSVLPQPSSTAGSKSPIYPASSASAFTIPAGAATVPAPSLQQLIHQNPGDTGPNIPNQQPQTAPPQSGVRQPSVAQSDTSDTPQHRRDFSPSALPPPLHTRVSPAPGSASASPASTQFPARKSSLSQLSPSDQGDPPFAQPAPSNTTSPPPRERTPSNSTKPLPFIRPADIYKRVQEEQEKERQSVDSERPSLDSLSSRPVNEHTAPRGPRERASAESLSRMNGRRPSIERIGDSGESSTNRMLQPMLEPVAERKSEYLPDFNIGNQGFQPAPGQNLPSAMDRPKPAEQPSRMPTLPPVHGISTFGDDFWSSSSALGTTSSPVAPNETRALPPQGDPGFRSAVDQAFTRTDDSSVPPTPISKRDTFSQSDSGVSRSNTDSTSGISPIMSRVPSSTASALKARTAEGRETSTPAIAEETGETSTPISRPLSAVMLTGGFQVARKPSPGHSRNVSAGSIAGAGLNTPSPGESPARSPAIEPQRSLPEPEHAVLSSQSPTSSSPTEGGFGAPSTNLATREADIASAMRQSPEKAITGLAEAEKASQAAFLESHASVGAPALERPPRSRSQSPSKSRVQQLAGKFNDISESRRGSTHSVASTNSISSWERSQEDLPGALSDKAAGQSMANPPARSISPVKGLAAERPSPDRGVRFRPKLPGQWESYTTIAPASSEDGEGDGRHGTVEPLKPERQPPSTPAGTRDVIDEDIDLTPTTAKHPVSVSEPSTISSDPFAALKAAGNAMGEAIKTSVGMGKTASDSQQERSVERGLVETQGHSIGDVYPRSLELDRTASSIASNAPPTPPPKDDSIDDFTQESNDMPPPPPPLKQKSPEPISPSNDELTPTQPAMLPQQLSADTSVHDQESDRLRKEIVTSLSLLKSSQDSFPEPKRASLQPNASVTNNRESSILPSEYDSYWADGGGDREVFQPEVQPSRSSNDGGNRIPEVLPHAAVSIVSNPQPPPAPTPSVSHTVQQTSYDSKPNLLDKRFSWEESSQFTTQLPSNEQAGPGVQSAAVVKEEPKPTSPTLRLVHDESHESFGGIPEPYFGPGHSNSTAQPTLTVVGPDPVAEPLATSLAVKETSNAPSHSLGIRDSTPPWRPPFEGLHVVNSENPEAVEMPLRLSMEANPNPLPESRPVSQSPSREAAPTIPRSSAERNSQAASVTGKPLGFREIMAIRSATDRIAIYNKTREHWATVDHGLNEWLTKTIAANPELDSVPPPTTRPTMPASGSIRHRPTGSISLFGKQPTNITQPPTTPYYEQYNAAASQMPVGSASTPSAPTVSQQPILMPGGAGGRSTSHHMQSKGKDILHSAGVLGGKATIGAKGLFAKGKSRFRSSGSADKAARSQSISSATTSREASEEPEWVTTPEKHDKARASIDNEDPKEKRRRLSSPFRRSRSRPSSVVLPKSEHIHFAAGTILPRETPPTEGSRPHSYAFQDSWNVQDSQQQQSLDLTPQRLIKSTPDRLGILPSPAKSAFSLAQAEKDTEIPPVPPIPNGMEELQKQQEAEEESQAHQNLQSVIRHSTPPVLEAFKLQTSKDAESNTEQQTSYPETRTDTDIKSLTAAAVVNGGLQASTATTMHDRGPPVPIKDKIRPIEPHEHICDDDDQPPQLNHDPLPPKDVSQHLLQPLDISPALAPLASDPGDISPVASSEDHDRLSFNNGNDDATPIRLEPDFATTNPQHQVKEPADVSPVTASPARGFGAEKFPDQASNGARDGPRTPKMRPVYETEVVGLGDVSPVSSHSHHTPQHEEEETTPTELVETEENAYLQPFIAGAQEPATERPPTPPAARTGPFMQEPPRPPPEIPTPGANAPGAYPETPAETPDKLHDHPVAKRNLDAPPRPSQPPPAPPTRQSRVLDAGEYAASRASTYSWEEESVPGIHEEEQQAPGAMSIDQQGAQSPPQNVQEHRVDSQQQLEPEVQPQKGQPQEAPVAYNRSHSLLSLLSSAVSAEGVPTSPETASSARSRPASSNRQHPAIAAVIPVETQPSNAQNLTAPNQVDQGPLSSVHDDGYDLYADHNGIVKDETTGEPVRIVPALIPSHGSPPVPTQQHPVPLVAEPPVAQIREGQDGAIPRAQAAQRGLGRPMSFVSLPRDAKGWPQEQINRENVVTEEARKGTTLQPEPDVQAQTQPQAPVIAKDQSMAGTPLPRGEAQPQLIGPGVGPMGQLQKLVTDEQAIRAGPIAPISGGRQPEQVKETLPEGQKQQQMGPPQSQEQFIQHRVPPQQQTGPPPARGLHQQYGSDQPPQQGQHPQGPRMQDPRSQDPHLRDSRMQDPRMQDPRTQDPRLQDPRIKDPRTQSPPVQGRIAGEPYPQDPRLQGRIPGQPYALDPRTQGRLLAQPYPQDPRMQGQQYRPPPAPRNEYEAQQQMMARQAIDPRLLGAEYQPPGVGPPPGAPQPNTHESGRPSLGSMFKSMGSRNTPSLAQASTNNKINPQLMSPDDANRNFSYQSGIGDPPTEHQLKDKKKERKSSIFSSLGSRPQSVGTESHISQESTVAHAADSRLDLRYPASPAPFKGIPPQVPPPGAPPRPQQVQPQRASTAVIPETGKKKRFSGLGSLFGRSGTTGHAPQAKPHKLSKEEKKAAKMQKPPIQQYQQPQGPPRQYPQPQGVAKQYPGPQGIPPQGIPQQYLPPQGVPQQYYPPPSAPQSNASAYVETQQLVRPPAQPAHSPSLASQLPPQLTRQISPPTARPGPPATNPSFEHTVPRIDENGEGPPPGGYYAPANRWSHGHGASGFAAIAQQAAVVQQTPNPRRVSSPTSMHSSSNTISSPISQRRVSSPLTEPKNEQPQIPTAYSNGAAPIGQGQSAALHNQRRSVARQSSLQYDGPTRQYSDPDRPNLSPQISGQSQMSPDGSYRASTSPPVVSPISNPSPGMQGQQPPPPQQQILSAPRMGSISEASHQERPWNISLPIEEAGEDEQAFMRQQHMMMQMHQQQMATQKQAQIRNGHTPSPQPPPQQNYQAPQGTQADSPALPGFREVLPRSSPQPYHMPSQHPHGQQQQQQVLLPSHSQSQTPQPVQPAPIHPYQLQMRGGPVQPASYPLPMSPDSANAASPINPLAESLPPPPPPKIPHENITYPPHPTQAPQQAPGFNRSQQQPQAPAYGPGYGGQPHLHDESSTTDHQRGRKPSIPTLLQHPQPSTMAASPQHSSTDMGAEALRQRLLEQEERDRVERLQKSEIQRVESERERGDRERARARARELEMSRGSVRSQGSMWERGGSRRVGDGGGGTVFELSAEEDEEPIMRGVSYPGMEWTPAWDGE